MRAWVFLFLVAAGIMSSAYGHGVGSEVLEPQMLGKKQVTMEVNSIVDNATGRKQITFSLIDTSSKITIRDVKYHFEAIKGSELIFEGVFETKNGILVLDLIPTLSDAVTVTTHKQDDFLSWLLGLEKNTVSAQSSVFKHGGLYEFNLQILEAEGFTPPVPILFESGISFPQTALIEVNGGNFKGQQIKVISYYELLDSLNYDEKSKAVEFSMPFEWTTSNINQTSVVHMEVVIPKMFAPLQVSEYGLTINEIPASEQSMVIDDYQNNERIIHMVLYQSELLRLYESQKDRHDKMNFKLFAKSNDFQVVAVTENVQYKISVGMALGSLGFSKESVFLFKIYDIFLAGKPISVTYDLFVESGGMLIYKTSSKSNDSRQRWDEVRFSIPENSSKIVIKFENLGGNKLARAEIPILIPNTTFVPDWIKNNANWWCSGKITDSDFVKGIQFLVEKQIISAGKITQTAQSKSIPSWIKDNSCWWSEGKISDSEFINGVAYLVKYGIIKY